MTAVRTINMNSTLKRIGYLAAVCMLGHVNIALGWDSPIGIPRPAFGIDESVNDTEFTHWVDNSNSACSNDTNGTPATPRCSVPNVLGAGSIVQVRGGPYTISVEEWTANGTASEPVFVRGPNSGPKVEFVGDGPKLKLGGAYVIIENIGIAKFEFVGNGHHLVLRHSHVHDHPSTGTACFVGSNLHNVVIWDNEINNNGVIPSAKDNHGVSMGSGTTDIWILDNHIHHNSGDAIQFCHGCVGKGNGPGRVYIGRNEMHHDEENAMDFKEFIGPIIVSQNIVFSYRPLGFSGNGDAIRINDEGAQGEIWIIYNEIYDSSFGISPAKSVATSYLIGNVIHDIVGGAAIQTDGTYVINNTIYDVVNDGISGGDDVTNNIINNAGANAIGNDIVRTCSHNLINGGSVDAVCADSVLDDPMLILDARNLAIGIRAGSPAIDAGVAHSAYSQFQDKYGLNIRRNMSNVVRPVGNGWDIGAHEFTIAPNPPTDVTAE